MPRKLFGFILTLFLVNLINAQTDVSGNQSGTWTLAGSPYTLVGDVTIPTSQTLSIEAGVEIYFPSSSRDINVNGILIANGTSTDSIKFYGPENSIGGYIFFNTDSDGSELSYCDFSWLGYSGSSYRAAVYLNTNANTSIANCSFSNNYRDIVSDIRSVVNLGVNDLPYIELLAYSSSQNDILPFIGDTTEYYMSGDLTISTGDTLTIEPGVNLFFSSSSRDINVNGVLLANGTATDSIEFYGPENSIGGYIFFNTDSDGSELSYCDFSWLGYSGSTYRSAIYLNTGANTSIANCSFNNNYRNIVTQLSALNNLGINDLPFVELLSYTSSENDVLPFIGDTTEYYMSGDITISTGDTLTIEPGVNLHFPSSSRDINVNGVLLANGTATDSINFYGPENSIGGYIFFNTDSDGSELSYCDFSWLGYSGSSYRSAIYLNTTANTSISNCSFSNNYRDIVTNISALSNLGINDLPYVELLGYSSGQNDIIPFIGDTTDYYMGGSITISTGDTLTVEPGVSFYFPSVSTNITANGTFIANGTSTDSIHFSGPENSIGGYIFFNTDSDGSELSYSNFSWLGYAGSSYRSAVYLAAGANTMISNCSFDNNHQDLRVHPSSTSGLQENNLEYVHILSGSSTENAIWPNIGDNKYLLESSINIRTPDTVRIDPGVKIIFPSVYSFQVSGTMLANGTATDSIYFQSNTGNTNYTGKVAFSNASSISKMSYCVVDSLGFYSGSSNGFSIEAGTSKLIIEHSRISNSGREGIRVLGGHSPIIRNCTIENNQFTGINILDTATPIIDACRFYNNAGKDIRTYLAGVDQLEGLDSLTVSILSSTANQFTRMPALGDIGKYYLENTVAVGPNDTLMIEAGAKILFPTGRDIQVNGTMLANGTSTDSIYFIKIRQAMVMVERLILTIPILFLK